MEATLSAGTIPVPERDLLTHVLRQGAQKMLAQAVESEVAEWIERHSQVRDEQGRRQVVRNGYLPERKSVTGLGTLEWQIFFGCPTPTVFHHMNSDRSAGQPTLNVPAIWPAICM